MAGMPKHAKLAVKVGLFKQHFEGPDGLQLLAELKRFCSLEEPTLIVSPTTGMVDTHATVYQEGKRAVLLHMMKLAGLTYHDIERIRSIDEQEAIRDVEAQVYSS